MIRYDVNLFPTDTTQSLYVSLVCSSYRQR